jgi:OOP family OmpA-OmpF porin
LWGVPPPFYYPYPSYSYAPYAYYVPYSPPPAYHPPPPVHHEPPPAPEAPAAAPAPATPREPERFVVYFPFDRDDLTPAAHGVIRAAAAYEARNGHGHVIIVGHTDTSGSEGYNEPLSERRARVVRGALVAEGVDPGAVQMDWRGERDLAVQTGPNVKEALNRRTTILIEPAG